MIRLMNENVENSLMELTELQDEFERLLEERKQEIVRLNELVSQMEHEAGIYIMVIEKLHKIAVEG